ncbi:MAG TPA: hypothetical protein VGO50_08020 [Pyrinomonadaceae bacterium]|jgi:hypothetical protein|nr:hypothetical protein [Pyrinomonadaceae bacterium]
MNPTKFGKLTFLTLLLGALLTVQAAAQENSKPGLCQTIRQNVLAKLNIEKTFTTTTSDGSECEFRFSVEGGKFAVINAYGSSTVDEAHRRFVGNYKSIIPRTELEYGNTVKVVSGSHWSEMVIFQKEGSYNVITFRSQKFYVDLASRDYPLLEQIESLFKDIKFENL